MKHCIYLIVCTLISLSSCQAEDKGSLIQTPLSGTWLIDYTSNDLGSVEMIMIYETYDTSVVAYTPKGASKKILGGFKSMLAGMFEKSLEDGSLMHIVKGKHYDSAGRKNFKGILVSAMSNYYIYGHVQNDTLHAVLKDGAFKVKGRFTGVKHSDNKPLQDYKAIVGNVLTETKNRIYNPAVLKTSEWRKFEKNIKNLSEKASDDLELAFGFFYYTRELPFSHYYLYKSKEKSVTNNEQEYDTGFMTLESEGETAVLKISSFAGGPSEADSIMKEIMKGNYKNLVIDLRDNTGGNNAPAMKLSEYLIDKPYDGGVLLTQKWFQEHDAVPSPEQYKELKLFSKADYDLLVNGIHKEKGLYLRVEPGDQYFKGNKYILINKRTASTCEPLVYAFKQNKIATVVGTTTAGAVLNGEQFEVGNGYTLVVPTADFYTTDNYHIDQNGVTPDVETGDADALRYVLKNLIK